MATAVPDHNALWKLVSSSSEPTHLLPRSPLHTSGKTHATSSSASLGILMSSYPKIGSRRTRSHSLELPELKPLGAKFQPVSHEATEWHTRSESHLVGRRFVGVGYIYKRGGGPKRHRTIDSREQQPSRPTASWRYRPAHARVHIPSSSVSSLLHVSVLKHTSCAICHLCGEVEGPGAQESASIDLVSVQSK